jgi:hypothetical protein
VSGGDGRWLRIASAALSLSDMHSLAAVLPREHFYVIGIATVLVCVWWLVMRQMFHDYEE